MMFIGLIPYYEFNFEAQKSRGPGGQNVNKSNTAVILYWNVDKSVAFSEHEKALIKEKCFLSSAGNLIIRSDSFRSQDQNKSECLKKLDRLLTKALKEKKKRIATKRTYSSKLKNLEKKKLNKVRKIERKKINYFDDE